MKSWVNFEPNIDRTQFASEPTLWLLSRRADFCFACGGASVGLLAAILLIFFHGNRELDALDLVLSEFHLGRTYSTGTISGILD